VSWQLRRATADDLDEVMALETATFPGDAWSTESMASELASPHGHYLVAVAEDGAIDAYAGLAVPDGGEQGDIQTIAVAERARRRGLGRALLQSLLDEARRRGASEVLLEVRADNPGAQALYESFGFERIAVRRRYYRGGVDAIIMRLVLAEADS
jgi:ribosomal-protein-alanine acetyltransferase